MIKGRIHLCELQLCYNKEACRILGALICASCKFVMTRRLVVSWVTVIEGPIKPLTIEPFASLATGEGVLMHYPVHVVANVWVCRSTIHVQFMYYDGYLQ
jgi:hypothetical protein